MRRNSIQILSLEVVLQRLDLQHGRQHQDADLEHWPPHGSDVDPLGFSMKPDLLLLHVVRLVEDLGELVVELDDLDLEPVLRGTDTVAVARRGPNRLKIGNKTGPDLV